MSIKYEDIDKLEKYFIESQKDWMETCVSLDDVKYLYESALEVERDQSARIAELEAQLAEAKKDAERLETLMAMSGEMYAESAKHHFIGRLKEFIDANAKAIDEFLKGEK